MVHEFGHFIAARRVGVKVEKFSLGFGKQLWKRKKGDTEYSLSAVPMGGFVKLAGDNLEEYKGEPYEYFSKSPGKRFQIIFAGPLLNYILGFLCFWLVFVVGYPTFTTKVGTLIDGMGAQEAGLQTQDTIKAIDGSPVAYWEDLQKIIQEKKDASSVKLTVEREGKEFEVNVKVKQQEFNDQLGQKRNIGLIGITPFDEFVKVRHGIFKSFILGAQRTWDLTVLTYKGLYLMISGKMSVRDSVTGPLGIYYITSKAAKAGITAVLHLVAVLSVSLAIFNLLPLPILDGGHILFLGIEKIRGKGLSVKTERVITQVGVTVIIGLALLVTLNDISRFFGPRITQFFK